MTHLSNVCNEPRVSKFANKIKSGLFRNKLLPVDIPTRNMTYKDVSLKLT